MSGRARVGLLFGGASVEHEVSVLSARGVAGALNPGRFQCIPIGVTREGLWLSPEESREILESGCARVEARVSGDRIAVVPGCGLLRVAPDGAWTHIPIDVIFPVAHGWGGEDGRLQGLLDLAGIPYVGAGVAASAAGMDKETAKLLCSARGIPVTPWVVIRQAEFSRDPHGCAARVQDALRFPVFVKPANGGSSVGVSKVAELDGVPAALRAAFECDTKAVVETGIDAREIECAVLGNDKPEASILGEVVPCNEFYDYAAKYLDGASKLLIPAALPEVHAEEMRRIAVEVFRALDLSGLARVDFLYERSSNRVYVNEANTLPGFTPISMYPKLWEATGLPYDRLLDRLIDLALMRNSAARVRATRDSG